MTDPGFASFDEEDPAVNTAATQYANPYRGRSAKQRYDDAGASGLSNDWLGPGASGDRAMQDFIRRGPTQLDPSSLAAQKQALSSLGTAAFGAAPASLAQRQEGAAAHPYDQAATAAEAAAHAGVSQAQQLAGKLDVESRAQQSGDVAGGNLNQEESKRRLGAQVEYGAQGGVMREQANQLSRFNASRQGNFSSSVYDAQTGAKRSAQQMSDASTQQAAQGAATAGMALLSLLALL